MLKSYEQVVLTRSDFFHLCPAPLSAPQGQALPDQVLAPEGLGLRFDPHPHPHPHPNPHPNPNPNPNPNPSPNPDQVLVPEGEDYDGVTDR